MGCLCDGEIVIQRDVEEISNKKVTLSVYHDTESQFTKVRVGIGATGYTLPIQVSYCMLCGKKIL